MSLASYQTAPPRVTGTCRNFLSTLRFYGSQGRNHFMAEKYSNPLLTVDIIVELADGTIVLIERKNFPPGWALPGGFVDYGDPLERAAVKQAKEETSLDIKLTEQFHAYSVPNRDPRHHTLSVVFIAQATGTPQGADDAKTARLFKESDLPTPI